MATNLQVITRVRDMLDEATAAQWSDNQIRRWINDGMNEMARRTRAFETSGTVDCNAASTSVTAPTDVIEIQHVYWYSDADTTRYVPLIPMHYEQMDNIWGSWQNLTTGEPQFYAVRGLAPNVTIHLYPVPDEDGTLKVFYSEFPTAIAEGTGGDASANPVPDGWVDILVNYVEYRALRKDRDPRWQEAKIVYEETLEQLAQANTLDIAHQVVMDPVAGGVPAWLANPDW